MIVSSSPLMSAADGAATSERIRLGRIVNPRTKTPGKGSIQRFSDLMRDLRNAFPVRGQHSPAALWKYVK